MICYALGMTLKSVSHQRPEHKTQMDGIVQETTYVGIAISSVVNESNVKETQSFFIKPLSIFWPNCLQ